MERVCVEAAMREHRKGSAHTIWGPSQGLVSMFLSPLTLRWCLPASLLERTLVFEWSKARSSQKGLRVEESVDNEMKAA